MCDLPEEELAEYLAWLEVALSRARGRAAAPPALARDLALEPVPAES